MIEEKVFKEALSNYYTDEAKDIIWNDCNVQHWLKTARGVDDPEDDENAMQNEDARSAADSIFETWTQFDSEEYFKDAASEDTDYTKDIEKAEEYKSNGINVERKYENLEEYIQQTYYTWNLSDGSCLVQIKNCNQ